MGAWLGRVPRNLPVRISVTREEIMKLTITFPTSNVDERSHGYGRLALTDVVELLFGVDTRVERHLVEEESGCNEFPVIVICSFLTDSHRTTRTAD